MYSIYALIDPRDNSVFYIGQSTDVFTRFKQHMNCEGDNFLKNRVVWSLRSVNIIFRMEVIEQVLDRKEALDREEYWITEYLGQGHPLTNTLRLTPVEEDIAMISEVETNPDYTECGEVDEPSDIVEQPIKPVDTAETTIERRMDDMKAELFAVAYRITGNIDESLKQIGMSTRYRAHARQIIAKRNLKRRED